MQKSQWHKIKGTILLTGETGTGKSFLAKKIHDSKNPDLPFITVNLATLQDNLLESELFGHNKGAFTGANNAKSGFIDKVGSGTLFLDEIADLNLNLQKKLLGILEEKIYYAVGSTFQKKFKGQIIVATNKNLEEMVKNKSFREDLYFRLKVFTFEIDPIRQNKNQYLLCSELIQNYFKKTTIIEPSAMEIIQAYDWPGNVRELKHALEYALTFCDSEITPAHLPPWILKKTSAAPKLILSENYYLALSDFEKRYFTETMDLTEGKLNQAARLCGLSKVTLITKLKKYEINNWAIKAKFRELKLAS